MAADFSLRFIVNRTSGSYQIRITDESTGFVLTKANTKITFPDSVVIENTDFGSPDISSPSGSVSKTLRLDGDNRPMRGSYTILFTAIDNANNVLTEEKTFTYNWVEPSIDLTNESDVVLPEVKFQDATTGYDQSDWTEAITTRQIDTDFPTTSDESGNSLTETNTSNFGDLVLDMVSSTNYYEGIYDPVLTVDILYTSSTYSYLTTQWVDDYTEQFDVRRTRTETEFITLLNAFKAVVDTYKTTNTEQFQRLNEEYRQAVSLFSHINDRFIKGLGDGSEGLIDEFLNIVDTSTSYTYQSGPIEAYVLTTAGVNGTGTVGRLSKFIGTSIISNSIITDDGSTVTVGGNIAANNLSGTNTGDQDISGIATNASAISTLDSTKQNILTEGAFVDGDKTKLDGIEAGAQVNDLTGSGTTNAIPKFTSGTEIADSNITDDGTTVEINLNAEVNGTLDVTGSATFRSVISSYNNNTQTLFTSYNTGVSNAQQFWIAHDNTDVTIDNFRGNINIATNVGITGNLDVNGRFAFDASKNGIINTANSLLFNIDSDNNNTGEKFEWATNRDSTTGGTVLMQLFESGNLAVNTDTLFVDAVNGRVGINNASPSAALDVVGDAEINGTLTIPSGTVGGYLDTSLGTNATALNAESVRELNVTAATYTASTTLAFSNVSNLRRFTMQLTNTNANVLTFSGVTLYFKSADLPSGVTFGSNALTFPADSAVKYNLVAEKFDGSTFDCKIEIR